MKKFVIIPTLAILLVIPLWAILGVLEVVEEGEGGHDHGVVGGAEAIINFIEDVDAFVEENTRPDGCVEPGVAKEGGEMHHMGEEERHEHEKSTEERHEHGEVAEEHHEELPVVYLQVFQFGYYPDKICLKSGKTYTFRMMATDVTHGASIQLGPGSRMVRLPPGALTEMKVTFTKSGEYMLYCSSYCGEGHQLMSGEIIVEPHEEHEEVTEEHEHEEGEEHTHEEGEGHHEEHSGGV
jgi:heme/copper-type cytochrome/quinol oxidase subunit 2